jgi:hypothetical protein
VNKTENPATFLLQQFRQSSADVSAADDGDRFFCHKEVLRDRFLGSDYP